jgi:hypothetical protein
MRVASLAAVVCALPLAGCPSAEKAVEPVEEAATPREPMLEVNAQFAALSNEGTDVDPALLGVKGQLEREGPHFSSFKLLSSARVELPMNKSVSVAAPHADPSQAKLTLKTMASGKADVEVEVADVHTTYRLGDEGPVLINYGTADGELVLVLSPVPARPRAAPPRAPSERRKRPDSRR